MIAMSNKRASVLFGSLLFGAMVVLGVMPAPVQAAIAGEVTYAGTVALDNGCTDPETCGMNGDDSYSEPIPIGFDFDLYGTTFTDVYLNINGVMHFGCPSSEYSNDPLPVDFSSSCDLNGDPGVTTPTSILAFWDDIITTPKDLTCVEDPIVDDCDEYDWSGNYATILYRTIGSPGSRKFIAQWTNMNLYSNPSIPLGTFQIILYEGSNEAQIQYRNLLGDPARSSGSSATIGIQHNSSNYTQYSHDGETPLVAESALRITLGEGYAFNAEATYDPIYLALEDAPAKPTLTSPADTATGVVRNPTLQWDDAANADNYTVTIATDSGFSTVVKQEFALTASELSLTDLLDPSTTYYWNVKATNAFGDEYSDTFSFTTGSTVAAPDDDDDVSEEVESESPNGGDANDDGTPDSEQPKVTSIVSPVSEQYVVLESSICTNNTAVSIVSEPANPEQDDDDYNYPFGLLDFTLTGCGTGATETITQYYYGTYNPSDIVVRKYDSVSHTYTVVPGAAVTQVTIGGQSAIKVVYSVTDGGDLDADGVANGTIIDPAGIAVLGATTSPAATAPNTGLEQTGLSYEAFAVAIALGGAAVAMGNKFKNRF